MQNINSFILPDQYDLDAVLLGAIVLLGDYNNWCQDAYAVDAYGRRVKPVSPDAVAWSIEGAIGKLSGGLGIIPPAVLWYLDRLVQDLKGYDKGVGWFNDHYDHGGVIDFLIEAYRRAP